VIPVNHLEGHIVTNMLPHDWRSHREIHLDRLQIPALCLVVSGGHTELVLIPRFGTYRVLGETLDDAAGEAFDKVAKMMALGFPGGPVISKLAEQGDPSAFLLPRPMLATQDFNFSFSGLKTAVLYTLRDAGRVTPKVKRDISASFQRAVVDVLVAKTVRAAVASRAKTVMIGGGVAANRLLREELGRELRKAVPKTNYITPSVSLTGDNALMIALAGYFNRKKKSAWRHLHADPNLRLGTR
jgi:N6-L-threonylcarbamoyladenine synthase